MINSQIQITQAKKMNIVHMISRNGYDEARSIAAPFLEDRVTMQTRRCGGHRPIGVIPRPLPAA